MNARPSMYKKACACEFAAGEGMSSRRPLAAAGERGLRLLRCFAPAEQACTSERVEGGSLATPTLIPGPWKTHHAHKRLRLILAVVAAAVKTAPLDPTQLFPCLLSLP